MKKLSIILFVALLSATSFSQSSAKRIKEFNLENKIAIQGYDPVAYFTQKKAVKGKSTITSTYEGVTYNFSSQTNKDLFLKNPTNYEPQYGGWCAYAMGENNEKVEEAIADFSFDDDRRMDFRSMRIKSELMLDKLIFEQLRMLRKEIARNEDVPPYVIFHDSTLHEMVEKMRSNEYGEKAEIIGEVVGEHAGMVVARTGIGGTRVVDLQLGEQLPRIC